MSKIKRNGVRVFTISSDLLDRVEEAARERGLDECRHASELVEAVLEAWLEREEAPSLLRQVLRRMDQLENKVGEMASASAAAETLPARAAFSLNGNGNGRANSLNGNGNGNGNGHAHHQANGRAAVLDDRDNLDDHTEDLFGGGYQRGHSTSGNGNGNGNFSSASNGHAANGNGNGGALKTNGAAAAPPAMSPAPKSAGRCEEKLAAAAAPPKKAASSAKSPSAKAKAKTNQAAARLREERRAAVWGYLSAQAKGTAVTPPLGRTAMQEATGITAKGVQTAIKELIDSGEIAIEQEGRGAQGRAYRVIHQRPA